MVRKFFVRTWYMFCCMLVTILGGCIILFFAVCSGFKGFACYFCDTINESVAAFVDTFEFTSGISQSRD